MERCEVEENWYRGLCLPTNSANYFCNGFANPLSFTEATVYAPLILILILYLPTITYIIFKGIGFYGLKNCINEMINDPVYFIFPIFTSFSFYEMSKVNCQENYEKNKLAVLQNDLPSNAQKVDTTEQHGDQVDIDIEEDGIETIEETVVTTIATKDNVTAAHKRNNHSQSVEQEKQFSIRQSNTLFFLFCVSSCLCTFGDLWHQWMRGKIELEVKCL